MGPKHHPPRRKARTACRVIPAVFKSRRREDLLAVLRDPLALSVWKRRMQRTQGLEGESLENWEGRGGTHLSSSAQKAEAGGSLCVESQPGVYSKFQIKTA